LIHADDEDTNAGDSRSRSAPETKEHRPSPPQHDNEWFELRHSSIQGLGAFARKEIPRGTRLIEYTGEKISYAESDRRYPDEKDERHHTFLFTLNSKQIVDAAFDGNDARFINHSCNPNCDAYIERGHIWIESIKRIPPDAEPTYDYQYEYLDEYTDEDLAFYACRCGAPNCRGTIVEPKKARRKR
jgi:SET domain-containing protein